MQNASNAEPLPPPRPLFRIVILALSARFLREIVSPETAAIGLGVSLTVMLVAIAKRASRTVRLTGYSVLGFALLCALTGSARRVPEGPLEFDGASFATDSKLAVETVEARNFAAGDHVQLQGTGAMTRSAAGPVAPASSRRRATRTVFPDECVRLGTERSWLENAVAGLRQRLEATRAAWIRKANGLRQPRTRALVQSLVFGEVSALEFELADLFTRTGTRHLLAVSGLHVSLVLLLLIGPCSSMLVLLMPRRFGARTRNALRDSLRLLALIALIYLAGARAPALRAAAAFTFVHLGAHLPLRNSRGRGAQLGVTRKADSLSVWALALGCECLAAGANPLSLSVRLSYGATLGLILGTAPITRWLRGVLRLDRSFVQHSARGVAFRIVRGKLVEYFVAGAAASIAATLVTLPFVWLAFGEWSPVGILATPLVLPLFAIVLGLSWTWIVAPLAPLESALDGAIELLVSALEFMDRAPCTPWLLPLRPSWWLAACAVPFAIALLPGVRPHARALAFRVAALVLAFGLLPWSPEPRSAELHLLDVGHGTAACLRAPGEPVWIFDAGSRDRSRVARDALLPLLAKWEAPRVRIALSHGDRDHCSALRTLVTRLPVDLWVGASPKRAKVALPEEVARLDLELGSLQLPTQAGSGLELTLLRGRATDDNEGSRSLLLELAESRVLLCGDAEEDSLRDLAQQLGTELPLSILLLPHHGSDGPNFARLLQETRPAEVWISHSRALSITGELERRGMPWKSTLRDGPLRHVFP